MNKTRYEFLQKKDLTLKKINSLSNKLIFFVVYYLK